MKHITHTHITNQTPGKYIHKKEKTGKTCFFYCALAFPALPTHQKKLKEKTATEMGREKK
jgi:hypothetical protein